MTTFKLRNFTIDSEDFTFGLDGAFSDARISFVTISARKQVRYALPAGLQPELEPGRATFRSDFLVMPTMLGEGGIQSNQTPRLATPTIRNRPWGTTGFPPGTGEIRGTVVLEETERGFDAQLDFGLDDGVKANILYISNLRDDAEIIVPAEGGISVKDVPAGALLVYEYPMAFFWGHQFVIFQWGDGGFWIHCDDYPVRRKRLILSKVDREAGLSVSIVTEADAPFSATEFSSAPFHIEAFSGGWTVPASRYKAMLERTFDLKRYEERTDFPGWAKDITLYVEVRGMSWGGQIVHTFEEMKDRLNEIRELIDPRHVMVYLSGWDDWYDAQNPEYTPAEELGGVKDFKELVSYGHSLGYRFCVYVNSIALNVFHPLWEKFDSRRLRGSDGSSLGWSIDYDGDGVAELKTGYVSLDCEEWRERIVSIVKRVHDEYECDGVFLDQLHWFENSPGENVTRGSVALLSRLQDELPPDFLLAAEGVSEHFIGHIANGMGFAHTRCFPTPNAEPSLYWKHLPFVRVHPIVKFVLNDYVRSWGHICMGVPGDEVFRHREAYNRELGVLPSIALPRHGVSIRESPEYLAIIKRAKAIAEGAESCVFTVTEK
jgi:hypothetical protein